MQDFRRHEVRRSLVILAKYLGVIGLFATLFHPRIHPTAHAVGAGGLDLLDVVLMWALPLGAYFAGKRWHHHRLFLVYGALGMLIFVPAYLSNPMTFQGYTRYDSFHSGMDDILHDVAAWAAAMLFAAVVCDFVGWAARRINR